MLGGDRATLLTREPENLAAQDQDRFRALIAERARRRPLQHLTGTQAFWRHEFVVSPAVLIPRPETELVVEATLEALSEAASPLVVDVGTGSGCIALSLAVELPDATVHGTDLSASALEVATTNARRLGLEGGVRFHLGDLLEPIAFLAGTVDAIVSNPPYVAEDEVAGLAPEVRDHEPREALVPPGGPLSIYGRLLPAAARMLKPGGWVVLEVGRFQAEAVSALAREAGLELREVRKDLQGIPRCLIARRPSLPPSS